MTPSHLTRRRLLTATAGLLALAGCSKDQPSQPRPLTAAEAERLAVIRFNCYNDGTRAVDAYINRAPAPIRLNGWVDYRTAVGYAVVTADSRPPETLGLVHWSPTVKDSLGAPVPDPPLPPPQEGWDRQPLSHEQSVFDAALAMILQLGDDRPENPLLLQQSDARWLRADQIGEVKVDVMTGPSPEGAPAGTGARTRYWVDGSGHVLRMEARIGQTEQWSTFDLSSASDVEVPELKA